MSNVMAKPALDAGIVSSNPDRLISFYSDVFELSSLEPLVLPSIGTVHKLAVGESVLRIMHPEKPPEEDRTPWAERSGVRYLTFEVKDAVAAAAAVKRHGGKVVLEPLELRPGRFVCQAEDPDGNMLEIGQG